MSSRPAHEAKQKVQDLIHQTVITRGLKSAGMFGAGGVGVHFALTYAFPRYARHSLPWKVFAMMMVPTAAFFTSTDIAAKELDREFAQQFSITPKLEAPVSRQQPFSWTREGMKEYLQENQFAIIGYGWATLVLTSLAYNFSQKRITMSQKFINARMVSQTGALFAIVAVAALHVEKPKVESRDLYFERVINKKD